jgi:hypothetical protein
LEMDNYYDVQRPERDNVSTKINSQKGLTVKASQFGLNKWTWIVIR